MAEAATATTRPARTRARSAAPAATAKPAKAAPKPAAAKAADKAEPTRFTVELEHVSTTKSFEKFAFPADTKGVVVGNVYAPIGTETVKVLIIGAGDPGDTAE